MKTKTLLATAICLLSTACNKNEQSPCAGESEGTTTVNFNIQRQDMSKVATDDNAVSSIAVAVFNSNGYLDASGFGNSGDGVTLNLHNGNGKNVYLVCNAADNIFSGVSNEAGIGSLLYDGIAGSSSLGTLGMSGTAINRTVDAGTQTISVPVYRRACKISVAQISNKLPQAIGSMAVTDIFLSNACGDCAWFGSVSATQWLNKMGASPCSASHLTASFTDLTIDNGGTSSVGQNFYCCPNIISTDSKSSTWCPRHTRVVLKTVILGNVYYYPIDLHDFCSSTGTLDANTHYRIKSITVQRLGSDSPEEPVSASSVVLDVDVQPWSEEYIEDIVQ